ncbi:glutathione S-transferase C-terminal domain-containing protein [Enterovirga sp.]|jgi:glutathione S-transferase|uniref:glutathione S-transferase family protein n=1 Tax=Enterovirga sp. TaxID=2026350 RepID=UPI00261DA892|nr:glutathione S-transferase C-terminal domain-containing protein [Enterovirga sp.]MDB5592721.1 glutathione S-transferase [Enterovirga sp.]
MKLYYSPGACSIGIHVLLEEIGKPYELARVNLAEGEQHKAEFAALNPKGKVPALLRPDGSILTEFPAIAIWLARTNQDRNLLPGDPDAEARAMEAMDYIVATLHMQGFSRMFRPANFAPSEADHPAVKARGREIFSKGLEAMDRALAGKEWVAGGAFSIADAALFYVEFWAADRSGMTLPPNLAAHYARMKARPAVRKAMADEGFAPA